MIESKKSMLLNTKSIRVSYIVFAEYLGESIGFSPELLKKDTLGLKLLVIVIATRRGKPVCE